MGYHHCHLPEVNKLEEQFQKLGLEQFIKYYSKYETLIGETDRMSYIQQKIKLCHTTLTDGGPKVDPINH